MKTPFDHAGKSSVSTQLDAYDYYRQLLSIAPEPACIVDLQGNIVATTASFPPLLGIVSDDAVIGKSFYEILSPSDMDRAQLFFVRLLDSNTTASEEFSARHQAGSALWLEVSGKAMLDEQDSAQAIYMVCRDISHRKKTELALKNSETHYRTLIESARSVILHMSPDGHILFMNKYAEELFGFSSKELIGQHVVGTIVPEIESMTNRDLRKLIEDLLNDIQNYRININENMRKNGERVWVAWSNGAIFDQDGKLVEICSVGHDVTEERKARRQLEKTHEQLKQQYAEIKVLQIKLQEQATRDPLTNLFNRRYLDDTFERELARCNREHLPIAIVILDIDHFKKINDKYGHEAGDLVLQQTAILLQEMTRSEDMVCRYGGEEFLAILPGASLEHAMERAENWRYAFEQFSFDYKGLIIRSTLSCGVSAFPLHGSDQDTLIRLADDALYMAKAKGRNLVCIADATNPGN